MASSSWASFLFSPRIWLTPAGAFPEAQPEATNRPRANRQQGRIRRGREGRFGDMVISCLT
ncbi:hypothetical protein AAU61_18115 [Desulfocarbo indianensis]|nr:hypothetical protein AAU61_18115 [Desulfocarbo indianensis]